MANTPVKTVRTVHLVKRDDGKYVWFCEDDVTVYGPEFPNEAEAKSWLFTPVVVEAEAKRGGTMIPDNCITVENITMPSGFIVEKNKFTVCEGEKHNLTITHPRTGQHVVLSVSVDEKKDDHHGL